MNSKERFKATLNHQTPDKLVVDFGATAVTGIHVLIVEKIREYFGLEKKPVKVIEPFQMLGEIDDELIELLNVDIIPLSGKNNMFGFANDNWKEYKTHWGQVILAPGDFNINLKDGDYLMYPQGDTSVAPCAKMPSSGYFFDAIIRQEPIDDTKLNPEDNLEEFTPVSPEDIAYWKKSIEELKGSGKGIIANFGGTALGDIALVPGLNLKNPKGIRDVAEWYMSTFMRMDYVKEIFDKQTDTAINNLKQIYEVVGNDIEALVICGTDFGTQNSTFCSPESFDELYLPYYKKTNDWIHQNTEWKTFKHSCGAVETFMGRFIDAGFDIINPVQINAEGMDPEHLKKTYGDKLTFWGGGVDTQKVLSFGTPDDVKKQVKELIRIFSPNGGFVFNTVHNIQANVPFENVVALIETLQEEMK